MSWRSRNTACRCRRLKFVINIIFFRIHALGAPTAIQDVITGLALLIIITVTTKVTKEIVKQSRRRMQ